MLFLGLGVALSAFYFFVVDGWLASSLLYSLIGLVGVVGIPVGVAIFRPRVMLPWWLIAAGMFLFVCGDLLSTIHDYVTDSEIPFPWYSDILYVLGYPFVAVGLIGLVRAQNEWRDRSALIDSLIVAVGAGSLSWVFLISPSLNNDSLSLSARIVSLAYPVADLALLALAIRFFTSSGTRNAAACFLVAGIGLMLAADALFGADVMAGGAETGVIADIGWLFSYIFFGVAALHPSMRMLDQSTETLTPGWVSFRRLSMLSVVALVGPAWLTIRYSRGESSDVVAIAVSSAILFLLALVRLGGVAYRLDGALRKGEEMQTLIQASESRFRAMVQHASDITIIVDAEGVHTYVSPSMERMLGHNPEDLIGRSAEHLRHPEEVEITRRFQQEIMGRPGRHVVAEFRRLHADASWRLFEFVATNLLDDPSVSGIVVNARDITERKIAEEELSRERDLLHLLMDNLPDRVFFQDREGRYVRVNRADAEFLGLTDPKEAIGKRDADLLPSEIAGFYVAEDLEIINERKPILDQIEQAVGANGQARWISTTKVPTYDVSGEISGIVGIARDITERQQAELTIHRAEQRYRDLFNDAPVMYVITRKSEQGLHIVDCNQLFLKTIGYKHDEVVGQPMGAFLTPESQESMGTAHGFMLRGERIEGERQLMTRDGSLVDVFLQAQSELDEEGNYSGTRATFMDITARKSLERQLTHQAFHDPLTGLPNRMLFANRLEHALARAARNADDVALLFIDLDGFKVINDSLGHGVGDTLLMTVAEKLASSVRTIDTIARFGGDEFIVLLEECDLECAADTAGRIARRMSDSFDLDGHTITVTASIGIACKRSPLDTGSDLIRNADVAMYVAKQRGKSQYAIFDAGMHQRAWKRLELESDLRVAIERKEFRVHYQPIIDLRTGETREVEALVRWEHSIHGLISPAEFLPVAEETGMILTIGWWVIAEACRQVKAWQLEYPHSPPLSVAVNLSPRMFHQEDLISVVSRILTETALEPSCLKLEITEGVMMLDGDGAIGTLQNLRRMGVRLSIDDFGTGYSSLAYLQRLPIDVLKIDRSFVSRMCEDNESLEIVRLVVGLAKTLGLTVVGEGIETQTQLDILRELGADLGQGYLLARPMSEISTSAYLANLTLPLTVVATGISRSDPVAIEDRAVAAKTI